jgi:hypothetical protein
MRHLKLLTHFLEEASRDLDRMVRRDVVGAGLDVRLDPLRELILLVAAVIPRVRKDHQTIVHLAAEDSADALARLSHRIERQKIVLPNPIVVFEIGTTRVQMPRESVLIRHAKNHDATPVVLCEIDTLRNLAAGDGEEYGTATILARLFIIIQGMHSFKVIFRLNIDQFVSLDFLQYFHFIPLQYHVLHVLVACKEDNNSVRDDLGELDEQLALVLNVALVFALVKL